MSVWLLPENIADMLPREARAIEHLRSSFLKLVTSHGFEVVRPPLVEYVDSLLTGTGGDLDLRTFKIVDQVTGKTMGIRADMTPQVARIDAHILNRSGVSRLCYVGSVLHARPLHPLASRQPYLAGVEMFGSSSVESEREVICLGIESLRQFGLENIGLGTHRCCKSHSGQRPGQRRSSGTNSLCIESQRPLRTGRTQRCSQRENRERFGPTDHALWVGRRPESSY